MERSPSNSRDCLPHRVNLSRENGRIEARCVDSNRGVRLERFRVLSEETRHDKRARGIRGRVSVSEGETIARKGTRPLVQQRCFAVSFFSFTLLQRVIRCLFVQSAGRWPILTKRIYLAVLVLWPSCVIFLSFFVFFFFVPYFQRDRGFLSNNALRKKLIRMNFSFNFASEFFLKYLKFFRRLKQRWSWNIKIALRVIKVPLGLLKNERNENF